MSRLVKLLGLFLILFSIWIIYNHRLLDRDILNNNNTNLPSYKVEIVDQVPTVEEPLPKRVLPKEPLPKRVLPKEPPLPPKQVLPKEPPPPKRVLPKEPPPKEVLPKEPPPKQVLPKEPPTKQVHHNEPLLKRVLPKEPRPPPKQVLFKEPPPLPKRVLPKELPPKRFLSKEPPPKQVLHKEPSIQRVLPKEPLQKQVLFKKLNPPPKRVRLDLYYECLCPDSRYFVINNLVSSRDKLGDLLDIRFWPYGKADTVHTSWGGYGFSCQHGEEECRGNIYHACVTRLIDTQSVQLDFIKCMINDNFGPEKVAWSCLEKIKKDHNEITLSWDRLDACASGRQGQELHAEAGVRTKALSPAVSFIPTVELEGSQRGQKQILKNLTKEICRVYQAKYKELPAECLMEL